MKKVLLTTVISLMMCLGVYAQTQPDYKRVPKAGEKVIGTVSIKLYGKESQWTDTEVYSELLTRAKYDFQNYVVDIREMQFEQANHVYFGNTTGKRYDSWSGTATCKVVDLHDPIAQTYGNLSQALNKAFRNVREGSRLAIDQVTVTGSMDREAFKDQLLDVLLDKGYKVVAKDYLEKLYDEIKDQGSGIYNDKTTVKEDNFSAVGYYINVKVTETSLRVQVVNVSTGEYEGNATVNF
jgi:hypothetical protein